VVLKEDKAAIGPRFGDIKHELSLSTVHVQTDADMAVYNALSNANNFAGYYLLQTIPRSPFPGTAKHQLDSMVCAMESKFALMKGRATSWRFLQRLEAHRGATSA
jgi:hypothetical protein